MKRKEPTPTEMELYLDKKGLSRGCTLEQIQTWRRNYQTKYGNIKPAANSLSELTETMEELLAATPWQSLSRHADLKARRTAFDALDPKQTLIIGAKLLTGDDAEMAETKKSLKRTKDGTPYAFNFVLSNPTMMRLRINAQDQEFQRFVTVTERGPEFEKVVTTALTHIDGVFNIASGACIIPVGGSSLNNHFRPFAIGLAHGETTYSISDTVQVFEDAMAHVYGHEFKRAEYSMSDMGSGMHGGLKKYSETNEAALKCLGDCAVHTEKAAKVRVLHSVPTYAFTSLGSYVRLCSSSIEHTC